MHEYVRATQAEHAKYMPRWWQGVHRKQCMHIHVCLGMHSGINMHEPQAQGFPGDTESPRNTRLIDKFCVLLPFSPGISTTYLHRTAGAGGPF